MPEYKVIRELGQGGSATVYLAEQTSLGRLVALKILKPSLAQDEDFSARFRAEGRIIASLRHPHIVAVYDVGALEGKIYTALEYLPLGSISKHREGWSVRDALRCVSDIADALSYAHKKGIVHRDVKPENILRRETGQFLLSDFGIARLQSAEAYVTAEGKTFGTPAYMSPEQWRHEVLDGRSDLYNLGIVLYQLLVGHVPYSANEKISLGVHHLSTPVPDLPSHLAHLQGLIAGFLAKNRDERFSSAEVVVKHLEQMLSGSFRRQLDIEIQQSSDDAGPSLSSKTATSKIFAAWPHRAAAHYFSSRPKKIRILRLILPLLILLSLVPWSLELLRTPSAPPRSIAVMPFIDNSDGHDQTYFADGLAEEIDELLTKIPGLQVSGIASVQTLRARKASLATIARDLHVGTVLEGTVRKVGSRIRVTAKLVSVNDGYNIWAESYERSAKNVFGVQDEIASSVAQALQIRLSPESMTSRLLHRTSNVDAYDAYLRGRKFASNSNPLDTQVAIKEFRRALALDPEFAAAHAYVAIEDFLLADIAPTRDEWNAIRAESVKEAERSVQLDGNLPQGYAARGLVRSLIQLDWQGAESDFRRALELRPGDADVMRRYAVLLASMGELDKAIELTKNATELDPLQTLAWSNLGRMLYVKGPASWNDAAAMLHHALQLTPNATYPRFNLGIGRLLEGHAQEAHDIFGGLPEDHYLRHAGLAMADFELGELKTADAALKSLEAGPRPHSYMVGMVLAERGDLDGAFLWLNRAFDEKEGFIATIKADPLLGKLRSDDRYAALTARMGLR